MSTGLLQFGLHGHASHRISAFTATVTAKATVTRAVQAYVQSQSSRCSGRWRNHAIPT